MSKRINRDDIDKFFDYGIYIPTRTVYLGSVSDEDSGKGESGTDFQMAELATKGLHILDAQSSAPITVVMNNLGGDWTHGMAIYDAIRACRSRVTVRGTGNVMSMGAVILQAGDVRVLTPNTTVMIHYGQDTLSNHTKIVARWAAESERANRKMEDLLLARMPGVSRTRLQKMLNFDTILSASEAVELGLADSVEEPAAPAS